MWRIWFFNIIFWCVFSSVMFKKDEPQPRFAFGVRIAMSVNSELVNFIAMRYSADGYLREKRPMRRDDFIKVVSGFWPSPFNPNRVDLFKEHEIEGGVVEIEKTLVKAAYCPALDSLWKIRYSLFPFGNAQEPGWSQQMYRPSLTQEKYLADRYNIKQLDFEFISGDKFWLLLKDVTDPQWISDYKNQ